RIGAGRPARCLNGGDPLNTPSRTFLPLACLTVTSLLGLACAKPDQTDPTGTGGTTGAGGTSPTIPAGFGQGGPFTFPQGKTSGSCTITSVAGTATPTMNAYNSWKSMFVTSNGAGGFLRVQSPQHASGTVSEGIGYGMLAAVYMNDRATF